MNDLINEECKHLTNLRIILMSTLLNIIDRWKVNWNDKSIYSNSSTNTVKPILYDLPREHWYMVT